MMSVEILPVTAERWPQLEALVDRRAGELRAGAPTERDIGRSLLRKLIA